MGQQKHEALRILQHYMLMLMFKRFYSAQEDIQKLCHTPRGRDTYSMSDSVTMVGSTIALSHTRHLYSAWSFGLLYNYFVNVDVRT